MRQRDYATRKAIPYENGHLLTGLREAAQKFGFAPDQGIAVLQGKTGRPSLDGRDYFVSLTVNERSAADFLAQSLVGPFKGLGSSFTPGESWSYDDGVLRWSFVTERESLDFYAAVCFVAQAETRSAAVPGPLLTLDDVAHRLQLHRDTVRDLVTRGALPVTRVGTGRGRLRVTPEALAEYIAAGEARGTPPKRNRA